MITKDSEWYWIAYSLLSNSEKRTGIVRNPYTNELIMEMEI